MELEREQIEETNPFAPAGEVVSPEHAEEVGDTPAIPEEKVEPTQEELDEQAELKAAGLESDTPAAHKWAEMRRDRRDAKRAAEEAKLEAARWKGRAEALAERGQVKEAAAAPPEPTYDDLPYPNEADYEDYSEYGKAVTKVEVARAIRDFETKQAAKEAEKAKAEQDKAAAAWISKGNTKFADFEAVLTKPSQDGGPAITADMAEIINSSSVSHELAYHLGKNVPESRRIAMLPPLEMAREMGKLEAKLTSGAPVKPRTQTNAPAPIKPISGDGATAAVIKPLEEMTTKEHVAFMDKKEFGSGKK